MSTPLEITTDYIDATARVVEYPDDREVVARFYDLSHQAGEAVLRAYPYFTYDHGAHISHYNRFEPFETGLELSGAVEYPTEHRARDLRKGALGTLVDLGSLIPVAGQLDVRDYPIAYDHLKTVMHKVGRSALSGMRGMFRLQSELFHEYRDLATGSTRTISPVGREQAMHNIEVASMHTGHYLGPVGVVGMAAQRAVRRQPKTNWVVDVDQSASDS